MVGGTVEEGGQWDIMMVVAVFLKKGIKKWCRFCTKRVHCSVSVNPWVGDVTDVTVKYAARYEQS